MEQLRSLRMWGNTWVLCLTPTDVKDRKLEKEKEYEADISDIVIKEKKRKKK